jgi:hypothetical protein
LPGVRPTTSRGAEDSSTCAAEIVPIANEDRLVVTVGHIDGVGGLRSGTHLEPPLSAHLALAIHGDLWLTGALTVESAPDLGR